MNTKTAVDSQNYVILHQIVGWVKTCYHVTLELGLNDVGGDFLRNFLHTDFGYNSI